MHLSHFGLIHQRKLSSPWYYPTQLALNLASERTRSKEEEDKEGILERIIQFQFGFPQTSRC
jgi:hypothetical protein